MSTTTAFLIRQSIISYLHDRHEFSELLVDEGPLGELAVMIHYGQRLAAGVRVNADWGLLSILRSLADEIEMERMERINQGLYEDSDRSEGLLLADARRTARTLRKDVAVATKNLLADNGF